MYKNKVKKGRKLFEIPVPMRNSRDFFSHSLPYFDKYYGKTVMCYMYFNFMYNECLLCIYL